MRIFEIIVEAEQPDAGRRGFLRGLGKAAGAVAATGVFGGISSHAKSQNKDDKYQTIQYPNNIQYYGEVKDGKRHGKGRLTIIEPGMQGQNNQSITINWENDMPVGEGIFQDRMINKDKIRWDSKTVNWHKIPFNQWTPEIRNTRTMTFPRLKDIGLDRGWVMGDSISHSK